MTVGPLTFEPAAISESLDPALPELRSALDPATVMRVLEAEWTKSGHVSTIASCSLMRMRWSPGVGCLATYRLTGIGTSGSPLVVIGVVDVRPEGIAHRLFTADAALPGLDEVTDPAIMRSWFEELLARKVIGCSIIPVTYRPGRRCVLRYELSGSEEIVLYGKVFDRRRAQRLASTLLSLGDDLVPNLVGVAPRWQLVVQADAGSKSLRSLVTGRLSPDAHAQLEKAGGLLAHLHSRSSPTGKHRSLREDADALLQHLPAVGRINPACAVLMSEGVDRLRSSSDLASSDVPNHGAFRLDQVHVAPSGPKLIDLDSYCWADPARDIGNLRAYLRWLAVRRPDAADVAQMVRDRFLAGYASQATRLVDEQRVRSFEAASLLKIAARRYRNLAVHEWDRVPFLMNAALQLLSQSVGPTP